MRLLPCGDRAVLLDCDSLAEAESWHRALTHLDPVLGARTVLVPGQAGAVRKAIDAARPADAPEVSGDEIVIPVDYDGPDLDEVAHLTGLSSDEVVAAHTRAAWTVAFAGFAPGFAYLTGGDPRLAVPRRSSPRPAVPAGSVGLAGEFSGIYPRSSPGGWQLIGRTQVGLFDLDRTPPALLVPGLRVRFEAAS